MDPIDRKEYVERYRERLRRFAYSPETLGWGTHGRQEVRFSVLSEHALSHPTSSVLDVGCGFADLYDYLLNFGWRGKYTGVDLVPDLLEVARDRHRDLDLRVIDITDQGSGLGSYDFVIASGVFNARLRIGDNREHIARALSAIYSLSRVALSVDFLSTYVDFQRENAWHTDPSWALAEARKLSRRLALRLDYMPYEFALTIFRDDSISERNVFERFEQQLSG